MNGLPNRSKPVPHENKIAGSDPDFPDLGLKSMTELLTAAELAKIFKVSRQCILDHAAGRRRPYLPVIVIAGEKRPIYRFDPKVIQEWVSNQTKNGD